LLCHITSFLYVAVDVIAVPSAAVRASSIHLPVDTLKILTPSPAFLNKYTSFVPSNVKPPPAELLTCTEKYPVAEAFIHAIVISSPILLPNNVIAFTVFVLLTVIKFACVIALPVVAVVYARAELRFFPELPISKMELTLIVPVKVFVPEIVFVAEFDSVPEIVLVPSIVSVALLYNVTFDE
jgi:hypothetical protein